MKLVILFIEWKWDWFSILCNCSKCVCELFTYI